MNSGPESRSPKEASLLDGCRVLLYHKQATSARTLFLRHANGSVIGPQALPALSTVLDEAEEAAPDVLPHPAAVRNSLAGQLDLDSGLFKLDAEFRCCVATPRQELTVHLAHFTTLDPPRALMLERGATFHPLTELRGSHPAEMELLRRAYTAILGG